MQIEEFLSLSEVGVDMRAYDKIRLLKELAGQAAAKLNLSSDEVADALLKREELGSTGTGGGIAIPHARMAGVKKPFGMLVRLAKAIDFDAIDGEPVDIVCLLLLPTDTHGDQLNALACAARALRDTDAVRSVRRAKDNAALYAAVAKGSPKSAPV
jgi:PTS system nitrogen regulatory IIA component